MTRKPSRESMSVPSDGGVAMRAIELTRRPGAGHARADDDGPQAADGVRGDDLGTTHVSLASMRNAVRAGRRAALAVGSALAAGLAIAPGIRLFEVARAQSERPAGEAASGRIRWGMLVDATRCKPGCDKCVQACRDENHLGNGTAPTDAQWIRKVDMRERSTGRQSSAPVMCQHCASPPCVDVCPTGASFKRADGIVLVDRHTCIGCRYCMMACPYKARSFVHEPLTDQNPQVPRGKGCVESCTLCVHRLDRGRLPACVETCPEGALVFGDLNDPSSMIATRLREAATTQIRADLGLDTGVRYQGL